MSRGAGTQENLGLWDPLPKAVSFPLHFGNRPEHVFRAFERPFRSFGQRPFQQAGPAAPHGGGPNQARDRTQGRHCRAAVAGVFFKKTPK